MAECQMSNCKNDAAWPPNLPSGEEPLYCKQHGNPDCEAEGCTKLAVGMVAIPIMQDGKQSGLAGHALACREHALPHFFSDDPALQPAQAPEAFPIKRKRGRQAKVQAEANG